MQALQFLKGLNPLPPQKEAADPSSRKESTVSSFKSMLEDASRKEEPTKAAYRDAGRPDEEVKSEAAPVEGDALSRTKKGRQTENQSERQDSPFLMQEGKDMPAFDVDAALYAASGEEVLFGLPVEQVSGMAVRMDVGIASLEDVTDVEPVIDLPLAAYGMETLAATSGELQAAEMEGAKVSSGDKEPSFRNMLLEGEYVEDAAPELLPEAAVQEKPEVVLAMQQASGGESRPEDGSEGRAKDAFAPAPKVEAERQESRFTIVDNRSVDAKKEAAKVAPVQLKAESVRQSGNTLDISFNLNQDQGMQQLAEQGILSTSDQAAASDGSTFQRMLANQLQAQAPEFVKAGSIILRDNDNGTINLNLKPEALGNVKITLHVTDKGIEGQIVVASKEAFEAFNQNMDNLRQSFRQSGFDAANLSLSLSDGTSAQGQHFAQGNANGQEGFLASKTFGGLSDGEEKIPSQTIAAAYGARGHQIDVVA